MDVEALPTATVPPVGERADVSTVPPVTPEEERKVNIWLVFSDVCFE